MAADATRAPQVREQTTAPDVQWGTCTVNSVPGALDDLTCRMERLRALFGALRDELHEIVTDLPNGGMISAATAGRLYDNWMLQVVAGEKLVEIDVIINATMTKAYDDRRAVAA